jgi:hypothetical protein
MQNFNGQISLEVSTWRGEKKMRGKHYINYEIWWWAKMAKDRAQGRALSVVVLKLIEMQWKYLALWQWFVYLPHFSVWSCTSCYHDHG